MGYLGMALETWSFEQKAGRMEFEKRGHLTGLDEVKDTIHLHYGKCRIWTKLGSKSKDITTAVALFYPQLYGTAVLNHWRHSQESCGSSGEKSTEKAPNKKAKMHFQWQFSLPPPSPIILFFNFCLEFSCLLLGKNWDLGFKHWCYLSFSLLLISKIVIKMRKYLIKYCWDRLLFPAR